MSYDVEVRVFSPAPLLLCKEILAEAAGGLRPCEPYVFGDSRFGGVGPDPDMRRALEGETPAPDDRVGDVPV
ncbi:hypothetical protein OCEANICA350_10210 [Oceanicaulis sp. 350]|nr:hypothetical protein OCEANICA350_10210 [Oceanicaulis sp. 350]